MDLRPAVHELLDGDRFVKGNKSHSISSSFRCKDASSVLQHKYSHCNSARHFDLRM